MKKIPYGISNYKELITENYYYVDKTMYLEKLENTGKVVVYLRPRRFGKTLFTSMMSYYYDINYKKEFNNLFNDTYIYNNPTPNKNNYYVLKFDFSGMDFNSNNSSVIKNAFTEKIIIGIKKFLTDYNFKYIIEDNLSPVDLFNRFLLFLYSAKLKHKLYLIIDEYDNFTNSILSNNFEVFSDILGNDGFVKAFYASIKSETTNGIIDRVFITGVCSISLDAMTSGFNIATNISINDEFNAMTALTHNEVKTLLQKFNFDNKNEIYNKLIFNYDGYRFSPLINELTFNPTLTMYYAKFYTAEGIPPIEMIDTNIISSYNQIRNLINLSKAEVRKKVINNLFLDGFLQGNITVNFELGDNKLYKEFNSDDIASLLFYFGYITIKDYNINSHKYTFKIPNKVLNDVFTDYFKNILEEQEVKFGTKDQEYALDTLVNTGDITPLTKEVSNIIDYLSFRDYLSFSEKDIKLIYIILLGTDYFKVYSEAETTNGYADLMLYKFDDTKYDILIELKYLKKEEAHLLEDSKNDATLQINKYIQDKRVPKDTLKKYAIIFINSEYHIYEVK